MARVPEPMTADISVAVGRDRVVDTWYGVCCDYMLEVAHMGCMWRR